MNMNILYQIHILFPDSFAQDQLTTMSRVSVRHQDSIFVYLLELQRPQYKIEHFSFLIWLRIYIFHIFQCRTSVLIT